MKFESVFENFKASSNGTDAFKQLKLLCQQAINNGNCELDCSAFLLIYGFAKNYVLLYEDQEVTPEFANKAKNQLIDYMSDLNAAIISQDPNFILNTLNSISKKYFESSRIF